MYCFAKSQTYAKRDAIGILHFTKPKGVLLNSDENESKYTLLRLCNPLDYMSGHV